MPANSEINELELGDFLQAYDAARANGIDVDLELFLPPLDHPAYAEIRRQLAARDREFLARRLRRDENHGQRTVWNKGRAGAPESGLAEAGADAAAKTQSPATAQVVVRVQSPKELGIESHFGPSAFGKSSSVRETPCPGGDMAEQLAQALAGMPAPGTEFLGFRILAELGRGAFGRVYLAQQRDLASRYVALKVSTDMGGESQALAQLQHTNIVPVYSVHRAGPYQAVCMPYFGATTVADLLKNWRERDSLPESGKELVSTLFNRKTITCQVRETHANPQEPSDVGPEAPADARREAVMETLPRIGEGQGTAILEMLEGLSFVQAVLWIASRLADGLAHAHERGILHRDLKPANVLLTDEGQPMLLDFSVAEDTKEPSAAVVQIGGTVCYMAPEHLEAFEGATRTVDGRSDLYSLGIILYEMLTRRDPYPVPSGSFREVLPRLREGRQGPPPRLRCWNKAVSPAAESIVRHCLEPDPAKRYQSAHELREDLDRHRADLPLKYAPEASLKERGKKWMRRHPRLTSVTSLAVLASVLLCTAISWFLFHGYRLGELEAQDTLLRFHEETKTVQFLLNARSMDQDQLDEGVKQGYHALAIYHALDNPAWARQSAVTRLSAANQAKLRAEMQDLLLLLARATLLQATAVHDPSQREEQVRAALHLNELADSLTPDETACQALLAQRAELMKLLGDEAEARRLRARATEAPLRTPRDYFLAGSERVAMGHYGEALPLLQNAAEQDPQNFWTQLLLGLCYDGLSRDAEARACYTTSIALWPEFPWTYFNRGLAYLRQNDYRHAQADFDRVIRLRPDFAEVYMNRALAFQGMKDYRAAIDDLTHSLALGAPYTRIYFMRARVRELAEDKAGARQDFAEGLRREPTDEKSWIARGVAKLSSDLPGALADFEKAAELNPRSLAALQNQAHVLSKLGRNEQAIRLLDHEIELYPDYVPARAGRGVLRARLRQREAAHEDAEDALARDFGAATQYQVAGIFALTSRQEPDDRSQALRYLSSALRKGYGFEFLEGDKDLDPIRDTPEFRQIVEATRALQPAAPKQPGERATR
jgi:serine/threonine protein kinase/Flp pilus assembly protein TadD